MITKNSNILILCNTIFDVSIFNDKFISFIYSILDFSLYLDILNIVSITLFLVCPLVFLNPLARPQGD
jgi:hypothetical protein